METIKIRLLAIFCLFFASVVHAEAPDSPAQKLSSSQITMTARPDPANIQLASVKAAVFDLEKRKTLYSKNADWVVPIASITKVMTSMVVLDSGESLKEIITISEPDRETHKNAYSRIRVGSEISRGDLMLLALMSSENLAANVLAQAHPGGIEAFVTAMNAKAKKLGMSNSHFTDPSGLSVTNVSTAADLVKMIQAALTYDKIREFTTTTRYDARFRNPRYTLAYGNTNLLVRRDSWDVKFSKTGYITEAGRCLIMVSNIAGNDVAMVFLDSFGKRSPIGDAGRVKRWLTTGQSGSVAKAARQYERERIAEYEQKTALASDS
ncbi:D-alanyl-D-alanine endopeptidase [Hahella sp. CCB-MM4]|uniref:D-alanyl-D-alanine endopeptidase n=1 Tax=Hahella sp. (strain CCB-MM4) TaxID=1926491 RepID=UPI000B9B39CA|nr:D-alanyl-D-alanine endopeptidase [Hahella sp. CCB-MM4]OZG71806.1 D-alanyl-D-alanine endopeptidase [Hahella sp. CCB-MM4]